MSIQPQASNPTTTYFDGLADQYARYRPSYPPDAIDFVLSGLEAPRRVADIGCGTGTSSRLLAARHASVIGIDPNRDMLDRARAHATNGGGTFEYRIGSGETTGLPEASVDLVLCAQSFHWFDAPTALREFHRILKSSGRLALMWNVRDDRDPFTAGYSGIAHRAQADAAKRGVVVHEERYGDPIAGGMFMNHRQRTFANPQELNLDELLGRARSASYFPRKGSLRETLEGDLGRLFNEYQLCGRVTLRHNTEVTLADRA